MDAGIENLLMLDGEIIEADSELEYFARFSAIRADITEGRPNGIKYSLTLHDKDNQRLMGFDNAHAIEDKRKGKFSHHRKVTRWDHKHKFKDVRVVVPYEYETAEKLLTDFWIAVDEAIALDKQRR
ncbi:toxin-antitoxin system TumE family protein [Bacterioplanoides sp.]|uniref:toxin-antitoxin system TumE family protein n=1 Tax=Bacterioplanoides sp. TaxID=2066072 RepID=UPI003B00AF23